MTAGLGIFWGTTFSLVLLAAYLPAAAHLQLRAAALRQELLASRPAPDAEGWMHGQGLDLSLTGQLARLAALLGPLLTGLLPTLAELLA